MGFDKTSKESSVQRQESPRVTPKETPVESPKETGVYSSGAPKSDSMTRGTDVLPTAKVHRD